MSRGFLALLIATLAAVAGVFTQQTNSTLEAQSEGDATRIGSRFFPQLALSATSVTTVELERASGSFALVRGPDGWRNGGIGDYPAIDGRIDAVIATLTGLTRSAPRTDRARLHTKLGVEDVGPDSRSTRVRLKDSNDQVMADLIVGQPQRSRTGRTRAGVYVRLPAKPRAWLTHGTLDVHHDAPEWSARTVVDVPPATVYAVKVERSDGDDFELRRTIAGGKTFQLYSPSVLGPGTQQHHMKYLSGIFDKLRFSNAKPVSDIPNIDVLRRVSVTATNGLIVTLNYLSTDQKERIWAILEANPAPGVPLAETAAQELAQIRGAVDGWVLLLPRSAGQRLKIRLRDLL